MRIRFVFVSWKMRLERARQKEREENLLFFLKSLHTLLTFDCFRMGRGRCAAIRLIFGHLAFMSP